MSGAYHLPLRQGVSQDLAYTGSAATLANPFGSQTRVVRLCATSACRFRVTEAANVVSAVTTDTLLPANWETCVIIGPGQTISAIRASTDGLVTATNGTLNVTELN